MPSQSFYKEHGFPTIWDIRDTIGEEGQTFIDEIPNESNFLLDACHIETSNDFTHDYRRRVEVNNTAKDAALDEGFYGEGGERYEKKTATTYRILDSRSFEYSQPLAANRSGLERRAENISQMQKGMVHLTADRILNGGGNATVIGKAGPGMLSFLDEFQNIAEMQRRWESGTVSPFLSENGLAIDNQVKVKSKFTADSISYTEVESAKANEEWTSIIGVDWGSDKMSLLYPKAVGNFGTRMEYHTGIRDVYTDKHDGFSKHRYHDEVDVEKFYGWCLMNRFALSGIRNIYLGHSTDQALFAELAMVERNLIELAHWHKKGLRGSNMTFYANERLVMLIAQMHQDRLMRVTNSPTQNSGAQGNVLVDQVMIAPGVVLKAEYAMKSSEGFVS